MKITDSSSDYYKNALELMTNIKKSKESAESAWKNIQNIYNNKKNKPVVADYKNALNSESDVQNLLKFTAYTEAWNRTVSDYDTKAKLNNNASKWQTTFKVDARNYISSANTAITQSLKAKLGNQYDDALFGKVLSTAEEAVFKKYLSNIPTTPDDRDAYDAAIQYHTVVFDRKSNTKGRMAYNVKNLINDYIKLVMGYLPDSEGNIPSTPRT